MADTSAPIIRATGLTKRFGDFVAVDDLGLEILPGTIFAFLGANGSGKSTTIRMLIGLLRPSAGSVTVDGVDVIRHPRRVRDHIGYMGQKVSLYRGLSLRENVEFYAGLYGPAAGAGSAGPLPARTPEASGGRVGSLRAAESDRPPAVTPLEGRWGQLRERFALGEAEHELAEDLPAGIRQRAGLALSILHRPRVLFLDEPTAGVDVHNRGLFWELIQEEAAAGVTVFVTTHFLEEADYCDWVCFIDRGRVVADAAPETLRRRFSTGYTISITAPAVRQARIVEALGAAAPAAHFDAAGLRFSVADLDAALLDRLGRISAACPDAAIHIAQPQMTDVFRRVLAAPREAV